jgi:uncharacterized membrane protein YsdA (DUF1294 family)
MITSVGSDILGGIPCFGQCHVLLGTICMQHKTLKWNLKSMEPQAVLDGFTLVSGRLYEAEASYKNS